WEARLVGPSAIHSVRERHCQYPINARLGQGIREELGLCSWPYTAEFHFPSNARFWRRRVPTHDERPAGRGVSLYANLALRFRSAYRMLGCEPLTSTPPSIGLATSRGSRKALRVEHRHDRYIGEPVRGGRDQDVGSAGFSESGVDRRASSLAYGSSRFS